MYKDICTGETRHAEAIQITFNPNEVAYEDLLEIFFVIITKHFYKETKIFV